MQPLRELLILLPFQLLIFQQVLSAGLYSRCDSDEDCSIENTKCIAKHPLCTGTYCLCKVGYYGYIDKCLKRVNLGEDCDDSKVCRLDSFCSRLTGKCDCPPGFVIRNNECFAGKALGESCRRGEKCIGSEDGVVCEDGVCKCRWNMVKDRFLENKCHSLYYGDPCDKKQTCPTGYMCEAGGNKTKTCTCGMPDETGVDVTFLYPQEFTRNQKPRFEDQKFCNAVPSRVKHLRDEGSFCDFGTKFCKKGLVCLSCDIGHDGICFNYTATIVPTTQPTPDPQTGAVSRQRVTEAVVFGVSMVTTIILLAKNNLIIF